MYLKCIWPRYLPINLINEHIDLIFDYNVCLSSKKSFFEDLTIVPTWTTCRFVDFDVDGDEMICNETR